ncbi:hypothetical protein SCHPADRAFT_946782 [Schizopora paradoxa]|uniref:Uncharacterized protein n=1 Tax=Schizopora paradoxa TaxID=27342 RepID=A0A0H2R1H8_9AGAM|nr:hypothetical protein SCHPADRAFT_946782 [Schizopora paradoxa]
MLSPTGYRALSSICHIHTARSTKATDAVSGILIVLAKRYKNALRIPSHPNSFVRLQRIEFFVTQKSFDILLLQSSPMFVSRPLAVVASAFLAGTMLVAATPTPPEVATVEVSTPYEPPYVPAPEPAAGLPSDGLIYKDLELESKDIRVFECVTERELVSQYFETFVGQDPIEPTFRLYLLGISQYHVEW